MLTTALTALAFAGAFLLVALAMAASVLARELVNLVRMRSHLTAATVLTLETHRHAEEAQAAANRETAELLRRSRGGGMVH